MNIATIASYSSACHLHRCTLPFKHLSKDYPQHQWIVSTTDQVQGFDTYWLYNGFSSISHWYELAGLRRRLGVKLVLTLDDTIWSFPEWRQDKPKSEAVGSTTLGCQLADLIVVSTPALAEEVNLPQKTVIAPNLIEVDSYGLPQPPKDDDEIRIMFAGGGGHWADLELIDDALCRIKEKYGRKVHLYFVGYGPDRTLRDWWNNGLTFINWVDLRQYWNVINQIEPHICLAPLVDCTFNHCKSNLRIMESWACNAAVVASGVGEYRCIDDGFDGLICHSGDEWFRTLCHLIDDRTLREQIATTGYERVRREFDWSSANSRSKWKTAVERVLELGLAT